MFVLRERERRERGRGTGGEKKQDLRGLAIATVFLGRRFFLFLFLFFEFVPSWRKPAPGVAQLRASEVAQAPGAR